MVEERRHTFVRSSSGARGVRELDCRAIRSISSDLYSGSGAECAAVCSPNPLGMANLGRLVAIRWTAVQGECDHSATSICIESFLVRAAGSASVSLQKRVGVYVFLTLACAIGAYAFLRISASASSGNTSHALTTQSLFTVLRAIAYYLLQFFLIKPQVIGPPIHFAPSITNAVLFLTGIAIWMLQSFFRSKKTAETGSLGLLFFFITISPSLMVPAFDLDESVIYERYLYLPSLGLCLLLTSFILQNSPRLSAFLKPHWMIGFLCLFGIVKANLYGRHWKNNEVIWKHILEYVPDHTLAWTMLGLEYLRQDRPQERVGACMEAVRVTPESSRLYYGLLINLAVAARESGNFALSESVARKAISLNELGPEAWIETGLSHLNRGERDAAESCFNKALEIKPVSPEARVNLAYLKPDGSPEQQELLESAIALDPFNAMAYNNLGILYAGKQDIEKAIICFEEAARLDPRLKIARENLRILRGKEK